MAGAAADVAKAAGRRVADPVGDDIWVGRAVGVAVGEPDGNGEGFAPEVAGVAVAGGSVVGTTTGAGARCSVGTGRVG